MKFFLEENPSARAAGEPIKDGLSDKLKISETEARILNSLISVLFSPTLSMGYTHPFREIDTRSLDKLKSSGCYSYIENFAANFGPGYSEDDISKLRKLVSAKGADLTDEQIGDLIALEKRNHQYSDFRRIFSSHNPRSVKDTIKLFSAAFSKEIGSLETYGERVRRFGLRKVVIYKKGRSFRAAFERLDRYELGGGEDLGSLHIADDEGRYYNSMDKVYDEIKEMVCRLSFLKRLISESKIDSKEAPARRPNDNELIKLIISSRKESEMEDFEKSLKNGGKL